MNCPACWTLFFGFQYHFRASSILMLKALTLIDYTLLQHRSSTSTCTYVDTEKKGKSISSRTCTTNPKMRPLKLNPFSRFVSSCEHFNSEKWAHFMSHWWPQRKRPRNDALKKEKNRSADWAFSSHLDLHMQGLKSQFSSPVQHFNIPAAKAFIVGKVEFRSLSP